MTIKYEIQGRDEQGNWDWYGVAATREDATYEDLDTARDVADVLVETTGWSPDRIRVVQVSDDSE